VECHRNPGPLASAARVLVPRAVAAVEALQVSVVQEVEEEVVGSGVVPSERGKRGIAARGLEAGEGARSQIAGLRHVGSPRAGTAGMVLRAEAHVARNVRAARATVVAGAVARLGRIAADKHRSYGGSEARGGPDCGGIAFRPATGGASEAHQGAVTAAAEGQARRPVA
jgi:hypothetical protein